MKHRVYWIKCYKMFHLNQIKFLSDLWLKWEKWPWENIGRKYRILFIIQNAWKEEKIQYTNFFCLFWIVYLKFKVTNLRGVRERSSHLLIHFPDGYNSHCWASLEPAVSSPMWLAGVQTQGSSADFPRPLAGTWIGNWVAGT